MRATAALDEEEELISVSEARRAGNDFETCRAAVFGLESSAGDAYFERGVDLLVAFESVLNGKNRNGFDPAIPGLLDVGMKGARDDDSVRFSDEDLISRNHVGRGKG